MALEGIGHASDHTAVRNHAFQMLISYKEGQSDRLESRCKKANPLENFEGMPDFFPYQFVVYRLHGSAEVPVQSLESALFDKKIFGIPLCDGLHT